MARTVDDEVVILDVPSGRYFGLNDVGALIWDLLDGDHDRDAILDAITDEFDIDRPTAASDLDSLLAELTGVGLVEDTP
jgi:hypothetical protein